MLHRIEPRRIGGYSEAKPPAGNRSRIATTGANPMNLAPSTKQAIKRTLLRVAGPALFETIMMWHYLGYRPHLRRPRSFSEKIAHRKLYHWREIDPALVDKYAVRRYVEERIGAQYLNQIYGLYADPRDLDFDALPPAFVIRATHGSQMNVIVKDRGGFNPGAIRRRCRRFLDTTYGKITNEPWYAGIPPRLLVERYITSRDHATLPDYKFYVFDGRVRFIVMDLDRFDNHVESYYDRDWRLQDFTIHFPRGPRLDAPRQLGKMLRIAETLAAEFDFLRVDLYAPDDEHILFGELTFSPGAGRYRFRPDAADFMMGAYWRPRCRAGEK